MPRPPKDPSEKANPKVCIFSINEKTINSDQVRQGISQPEQLNAVTLMRGINDIAKREGVDISVILSRATANYYYGHRHGNYQTVVSNFFPNAPKSQALIESHVFENLKKRHDIRWGEVKEEIKEQGGESAPKGMELVDMADRISKRLVEAGKPVYR